MNTINTRRRLVALLTKGWQVTTFCRLKENDKAFAAGFRYLYHLQRGNDLVGFYVV